MLSASRGRHIGNREGSIPMGDWNDSSFNLHLDLYNFESEEGADDSPYILSSPRSLEACMQLDVKPIELLHKDLMQFEEDCLLTGQPLSTAKTQYKEHEQQRLRKLKQCRCVRERLILHQEHGDNLRHGFPSKASGPSHGLQSSKTDQDNIMNEKAAAECGQGDNKNWHKNSPQRLTMQRSKSPAAIDRSSRSSTASPTYNKTSSKHWRATQSSITYQPSNSPEVTAPKERSKVRGQRPASSCSSSRRSTSRLSMSSLASALSDQDQKILDLLEKKYQDQQFLEKTRLEMRLAWDEQRQAEERSKVSDEMQRRKNLAEMSSLRQRKKEKFQRQKQRKKEQELKDSKMNLRYKDMHHERLLKEQQTLMQHQIQLKKLEDSDKKKRQEMVLKRKELDEAEYRQAVSHYVDQNQEKAEQLRRDREHQESMELKKKNVKGKLRHLAMKASLDKDNEEYMSSLKDCILMKQSKGERAASNQQWLQQHEINLNRQKEDALQEKSRQSRLEMEEENRQWQRHLMHQSLMSQERAAQQANETVQSKASKARQARRSRELTQRQLKQRVEEDDALFQDSIKMSLAYKDMKSQTVAAQKQDAVQRSRVVAKESAKLRDQIRQQYQGSFDKMVERANHQSRFGRGPQMSTKNHTTLTLA